MNILIVDDDLTSRLILEATLKKLGHDVISAHSGVEALAIFHKGAVSLLISDMVMPDLDGLELCRQIRAAGRAQYTYIIMLTSVSGKHSYLVGMKAGADDFIVKPFDEDLLAARLVVAERILNLQSQVNQLSGLLPICALCKKVRDDHNYWEQVESYVAKRTDAKFTHSYCPDCFNKLRNQIRSDLSTGGPAT
jgi:DNA-binding response OmpR family regulator